MKNDNKIISDYLNSDSFKSMFEAELNNWFRSQYFGKTKQEIKSHFEINRDHSSDYTEISKYLDRELKDYEEETIRNTLLEDIIDNMVFKGNIAISYYDTAGSIVDLFD